MNARWLDRSLGELYCYFTLCTTEEAFAEVCKHLNVPKKLRPKFLNDGANATVHEFENGSKRTVVVNLGPKSERSTIQVYALLVHEAVHIYQWHKESTGEHSPSKECEAYAIQSIAQNLMLEYKRQVAKTK